MQQTDPRKEIPLIRACSTHREAFDQLAEKWAQTNDGAQNLALSYLMTRDERIAANVEIMGQPYSGWDMGQLSALHCLTRMYASGYLAIAQFFVSAAPKGDSRRKENHSALQQLPDHFVATVNMNQRGAEGDGFIKWGRQLSGIVVRQGKEGKTRIKPGGAILEIGNTDASNVCLQLRRYGAVARWPYGHHLVTIIAEKPRCISKRWCLDDPPDDQVFTDLVECLNKITLSRMSRRLAWGINADRPSAQERVETALRNFAAATPTREED